MNNPPRGFASEEDFLEYRDAVLKYRRPKVQPSGSVVHFVPEEGQPWLVALCWGAAGYLSPMTEPHRVTCAECIRIIPRYTASRLTR